MLKRQLRGFTYFVLSYMLLAFVWWSVLLHTKNEDAFRAKSELLQIGMAAECLIDTPEEYYASPQYQALKQAYQRQKYMIWGETTVLILSLMAGIYIIYRGYQREVEASRQQSNFLLSITHELKSPIAGIRLILQTIQRRRQQLEPAQLTRLSEIGIKEVDRLNRLVEDLLLSARLETAYQFRHEPLDLHSLAQSVVDRMQLQHPEAEIALEAASELPIIKGDAQALTSVFVNLIENAIKYTHGPAKVKVKLAPGPKNCLVVKIADQGIGISKENHQRIFQKFFRVGSEETRQTKGTGLGLFIVKEIVAKHGGQIKVMPNHPQGTVFQLTFPCATESKVD
ncbi:MAG: sensor histidine kinase [Bacteroidetes bacterium]|nr:MAG: sensor histidine kinase [Bacteroidota bacterium]